MSRRFFAGISQRHGYKANDLGGHCGLVAQTVDAHLIAPPRGALDSAHERGEGPGNRNILSLSLALWISTPLAVMTALKIEEASHFARGVSIR